MRVVIEGSWTRGVDRKLTDFSGDNIILVVSDLKQALSGAEGRSKSARKFRWCRYF